MTALPEKGPIPGPCGRCEEWTEDAQIVLDRDRYQPICRACEPEVWTCPACGTVVPSPEDHLEPDDDPAFFLNRSVLPATCPRVPRPISLAEERSGWAEVPGAWQGRYEGVAA